MVDLLNFDDFRLASLADTNNNDCFENSFWGEKYEGFTVLCNNLKQGQASIKTFQEFIRDRAATEDIYSKHLTKLAKFTSQTSSVGSFSPMFDILRSMCEKLSSCHADSVLRLNDIIKELSKYNEEYKSKQKQMKDKITSTHEALQQELSSSNLVLKAKEKYHNLNSCMEKSKGSDVNTKEVEKWEIKVKKSLEDYKSCVEKHKKYRIDCENKMTDSCKKFQEIEEFHLTNMKKILDTSVQSFENANILISQVYREIQSKVDENTVSSLVKQYCKKSGTGNVRPAPITFEEYGTGGSVLVSIDSTASNVTQNGFNQEQQAATNPNVVKPSRLPLGLPFLRKKGPKNKKRSPSSFKDGDKDSVESLEKEVSSLNVDEEGYTIRPDAEKEREKNWKYESSEDSSDSDEDDDFLHKKIQIKIRPKDETPTSPNETLEALNSITQKLTLNPPNMGSKKSPLSGAAKLSSSSSRKTSKTETPSDQMFNFPLPTNSGSNPNQPSSNFNNYFHTDSSQKKSAADRSLESDQDVPEARSVDDVSPTMTSSTKRTFSNASLNNLLVMSEQAANESCTGSKLNDATSTWPSRKTQSSSNSVSIAEKKKAVAPLATCESWSSISSSGATTPSFDLPGFNSISRGPSPLTLSHTDTIPIAVAFTEIVDAYITQTPSIQYLTKISGDLQMSFPAGIIRTLTSNPNPPTLSFKIRDIPKNVELKHHKTLLQMDSSFNEDCSSSFWFNMSELIVQMRKMTEANPNSLYYNITILNYQMGPIQNSNLLPLHFFCKWKCSGPNGQVDVTYNYNEKACSHPLKNLTFILPLNINLTSVKTTPTANWRESEKRLVWSIPNNLTSKSPSSCLSGLLGLEKPLPGPLKMAAVFSAEGATLSGTNFELSGSGYRLSLTKRRFKSGKYFSSTSDK